MPGLPAAGKRGAHPRELGSQCVPWELCLARVVIIRQVPGSRMTLTPQSRSVEMLRPNAGWRARATFGQGTVTIGRPRPIASLSSPSASVSLIPAAHLLMVLKVAGAAANALAGGKISGASGSLKLGEPDGWSAP